MTKIRSPGLSRKGARSGATTIGRIDEGEKERDQQAVEPDRRRAEVGEVQREPEHGEDGDLAQAGERLVEVLDLALERRAHLGDQQPGDEDGEEPGAVRDRGKAVDDEGEDECADRVEPLAGQRDAPHQLHQHERADQPDRQADDHRDREVGEAAPERGVLLRRVVEDRDHQRDPDRVVRARLALEDRPRAAADLAVAEDGEHDGRIGGGDRRAEDPRRRPPEVEEVVGRDRDDGGRGEGADDAERGDRPRPTS